jgi:hypothetical protein
MSFIKNLQKNISKVTEGYFANWTPDMPISVGDYGDIKGYRFTRDGNASRYIGSIEIEKKRLKTATLEKKDGLIIAAKSAGSADANVSKKSLNLKFGSEGSFLYHLKDLTNYQYKERREAFEKLGKMILSEKIKWKDDYVIVTEVKQAGKALILVADSANADMEIECEVDGAEEVNLASVVGNIGYTRDSDRILRYEIEQNTPILFRVVGFTEVPPGGGPTNPISKMMAKIREWFEGDLPKPETIYLRDYVESDSTLVGMFELPNNQLVTLGQKLEDIASFIEKSEKEDGLEEDIEIEKVQLNQRTMYI